jgi:hypothetical protein
MAVREIRDHTGTTWRVWCITPEAIHPVTRAEDYLADCYQLGWLVFETTTGDQKRRLCPFPKDWFETPDEGLLALLQQAETVNARKRSSGPVPEVDVTPRERAPDRPHELEVEPNADLTDLTVIRTFRYPGGRLWTVAVMPNDEGANASVLRFTAGARSIELRNWPRDWPDLPDDRLVDLLRHAAERPTMRYTPETPRRRYNDPPA